MADGFNRTQPRLLKAANHAAPRAWIQGRRAGQRQFHTGYSLS